MKILVVLLALFFGVWLWRRGRVSRDMGAKQRQAGPAAQSVVACSRCGVHVLRTVALQGRSGVYCCAAHRQEAEGG